MPRRYTRNYRRYGNFKRRKWSPVFVSATANLTPPSNFNFVPLAQNTANVGTNAPISTIIKVKNFKVVADIIATRDTSTPPAGASPSLVFSIMFVPQGYAITQTLMVDHPEWIMAWRAIDYATTNTVQVSSRLSRNLNSGDQVVLFFTRNVSGVSVDLAFGFQIYFVTCNN